MRATLLHLMANNVAYNRLRSEIDTGIADGTISSPISDSEARKLPYLQACIREGLRIWPPVTGMMSKTVPKGGDTLNGVFVPGGTDVGYCAWGLQRIKSVYGDDAETFRPERWLDVDEEKFKEMKSLQELVFVYGKWQCPGKDVAAIELNKVFVEVCPRSLASSLSISSPIQSKNTLNQTANTLPHSYSDASTSPSATPHPHGKHSALAFTSNRSSTFASPQEKPKMTQQYYHAR